MYAPRYTAPSPRSTEWVAYPQVFAQTSTAPGADSLPANGASTPKLSPLAQPAAAQPGRSGATGSGATDSSKNRLGCLEEALTCPITLDRMVRPVTPGDGHSYDEAALTEWVKHHGTSPLTQQPLRVEDIKPNYALRDIITAIEAERTAGLDAAADRPSSSHAAPPSLPPREVVTPSAPPMPQPEPVRTRPRLRPRRPAPPVPTEVPSEPAANQPGRPQANGAPAAIQPLRPQGATGATAANQQLNNASVANLQLHNAPALNQQRQATNGAPAINQQRQATNNAPATHQQLQATNNAPAINQQAINQQRQATNNAPATHQQRQATNNAPAINQQAINQQRQATNNAPATHQQRQATNNAPATHQQQQAPNNAPATHPQSQAPNGAPAANLQPPRAPAANQQVPATGPANPHAAAAPNAVALFEELTRVWYVFAASRRDFCEGGPGHILRLTRERDSAKRRQLRAVDPAERLRQQTKAEELDRKINLVQEFLNDLEGCIPAVPEKRRHFWQRRLRVPPAPLVRPISAAEFESLRTALASASTQLRKTAKLVQSTETRERDQANQNALTAATPAARQSALSAAHTAQEHFGRAAEVLRILATLERP